MKIDLQEGEDERGILVTASIIKEGQIIMASHVVVYDLFVHDKLKHYWMNYARNKVTREVIEEYYKET